MRILVIQFLRGMYENSKDSILLSTNPRSATLRELVLSSPEHEFVMLSINRRFRTQRSKAKPRMVLYDIPPTRMLWMLYVSLFSLLLRARVTICFGIEITAAAGGSTAVNRSDLISVIGSDIGYLEQQYRLPKPVARMVNAAVRLSLGRASHIFVPNQRASQTVARLVGPKAHVSEFKYRVSSIFSPGSPEKLKPSSPPLVLTVSRLSPVKGLEYLILAAKEVIRSLPVTTFKIQSAYEDPAYQERLEKLMSTEGVRGHFAFGKGAIPNVEMPELYRSADLYVLPSLTEGRNSSVIEALACGLPVVATRVGANAEVVVDAKNGFLVEPKDSHALADRIIKILSDSSSWLGFSRAARDTLSWSEEYDLGSLLHEATMASERTGRRQLGSSRRA